MPSCLLPNPDCGHITGFLAVVFPRQESSTSLHAAVWATMSLSHTCKGYAEKDPKSEGFEGSWDLLEELGPS